MQLSDLSPSAQERLPRNAVSIADGVAAVTISPFTRELNEAEKAAILAANRQRVFVRAWSDADQSRPGLPVQFSDYPPDTMRWCVDHASLICFGALERESRSNEDIETLLSQFDTDEVAEQRFVLRLVVEPSFDISNCPWLLRPCESPPIIHSINPARRKEA
jgi:hypothetical protein